MKRIILVVILQIVLLGLFIAGVYISGCEIERGSTLLVTFLVYVFCALASSCVTWGMLEGKQ